MLPFPRPLSLGLTLLWIALGAALSGVAEARERDPDLSEVVRRCLPAVVTIQDPSGETFGSGVLVSGQGVVVTAEHLFEEGGDFVVALPGGRRLPFRRFLSRDADLDLAAFEVEGSGLPSVPLGDPSSLALGAPVLAIGHPAGLEGSVSAGLLSGRRAGRGGFYELQFTAPISGGSSGGGLFDQAGRLVGITVSYSRAGQNLNFAVPVSFLDLETLPGLDARIQAAPEAVAGYLERARAYLGLEDYSRAHSDVRTALSLAPRDPQVVALRGELFYRQGLYQESLRDFSDAVALEPGNPRHLYDRAYTLRALDDLEGALSDLQEADRKGMRTAWVQVALGETLTGLGRHGEAVEAWTQAIRLDRDEELDQAWLLRRRGEARLDFEDPTGARADLERSVELDPEDPWAHYALGQALAALGNQEGGLRAFSRAIDLDPGQPRFYWGRSEAYQELERYEKALADVDEAIELGEVDAWSLERRGHVLTQLRRFQRASAEFSRALELEPGRLTALVWRACAYLGSSEVELARRDCHTVMGLAPGSEEAGWARTLLEEIRSLREAGD